MNKARESQVITETPSNVLIKRLRPSIYIPSLMVAWSICMTLMYVRESLFVGFPKESSSSFSFRLSTGVSFTILPVSLPRVSSWAWRRAVYSPV